MYRRWAKVHKGKARLSKLNKRIHGFDLQPSSPILNPIEKIWRWMKHEIIKIFNPSCSCLPSTITSYGNIETI